MAHLPSVFLFVPADRPERYAKALLAVRASAGAVIIDLEDAVAPEAKVAARATLLQWLTQNPTPEAPLLVRINADGSDWFEDDLRLLGLPAVHGVMLPKTESETTLAEVAAHGKPLIALVETAQGMAHARALARGPGVARMAFGAIDFQLDLGIGGDDRELDAFRSELVLASRLAGLPAPIDGVTTAIDDVAILEQDSLRAKRFGFGAKLCIHPRQLAPVAAVFAPSAQEIAWAERIRQAIAAAAGGAVSVEGKMVDKPVALLARRILEQAGRQW